MGTRKKLANFHPRSDEVTQLGTAPTMAAARSAAAAPYPAPASHPPAGQPKRNILPRVAGLSRGQAPPQKVQKLTPLARPVPNKKALPHLQESKVKQLKTQLARPVPKKKASPHPQESPNPAVLSSANPSTSGSGETGELVAQIGLAHAQRRGEVHHSSDGCQCRGAPMERRFLSTQKHLHVHSRATHITDLTYDVLINQNENQMSAVASWSALSWDQGDVEALNKWSRCWTSCDSLTSIGPSMQPCYCVNCKRKQNRQTVSQVGFRNVEHVSRVTPRLRFQSFGRFSNANGLPTMPCLSSDATATPSMGSSLSLNDTATPSMKSCLSPPSLSAQSTHSMVTCLTSDGHPTETKMPENGIPDTGWTSPMVVTAISSLPILPQVPCGTQTEEPPSTSSRGPRFKTKKRTTRLAGGRKKSSRKLSAAPQLFKKILVGTVVGFLFVGMTIALFFTDVP